MAQQPYQLIPPNIPGGTEMIYRVADQAYIPKDGANRDYAEYLEWEAAGNTPDPWSPPPETLP